MCENTKEPATLDSSQNPRYNDVCLFSYLTDCSLLIRRYPYFSMRLGYYLPEEMNFSPQYEMKMLGLLCFFWKIRKSDFLFCFLCQILSVKAKCLEARSEAQSE